MSKALDKRARDMILKLMEELGELTTEAVMDLIRPHYMFDPFESREREIRRKAHRVMSQFRDDKGDRTCYNCTDNGQSKYINVDTTSNVDALKSVNTQLRNKYLGLRKGRKKVTSRLLELAGQTKLFEGEGEE